MIHYLIILQGQTAQFVCITTRPPPPNEIAWFKDGSLLRNLKRITIDQETGGLVTIIDTRITDEGEYMCIATNRIGERESINFTLTISSLVILLLNCSLSLTHTLTHTHTHTHTLSLSSLFSSTNIYMAT